MVSQERTSGVEIVSQGHLLTVKPFNQLKFEYDNGGATRGMVNDFSGKSRKRLLELVARLKSPGQDGYRGTTSFLTLTTQKIYHPADFKPLMFTWLKRLKRKSPTISAVWRIEYQKRGAAHAHLILYNAPYVNKDWIQKTWGEVIEQERPFTRIERVANHRAVMSYASKYIAKRPVGFINLPYLTADKETGEIRSLGRQWGVYNRNGLPFDKHETVILELDGSWWLIKNYCQRLWRDLPVDDYLGFTIFCDNPAEHLAKLVTISKQYIGVSYP